MSENTPQNIDKKEPQKSPHILREEKILDFWQKNKIFERSIGVDAPHGARKGELVFYDGPPFATGLPHFGHILPTSIKDAVPRFKTMQGYRIRRRWGWDCHGLPVENVVEKELGLKTKKDILDFGIGRFNDAARASVLRYAREWRTIIPRLGRWVDMDHDYETMHSSYTESVWWAFKTLHEKGLIYEGFKVMQFCPRCETSLSNFEVNQGYQDITDISIYVKFALEGEPNTFMLAWTTTPWTLPGNVALAVNPAIDYVKVKLGDGATGVVGGVATSTASAIPATLIFAKERLAALAPLLKDGYTVLASMKGSELVGKKYTPVFDYYVKKENKKENKKESKNGNAWKIYPADFVTTTDGTGVVHIAPAFGADDLELGTRFDLLFIQHVATNGTFKKEVTDFVGQHAKPKDGSILDAKGVPEKDAHQKGDIEIIKYLASAHPDRGVAEPALFAKEKIVHSYPHCWRCGTPLLNYATSSWFLKVTSIKDKLVSENKKINWQPAEVGEGRFGNWLLGARDWSISRSRFWGAPLPVWRVEAGDAALDKKADKENAEKGENEKKDIVGDIIIGSIADLKKYSKSKNTYYVVRHGEADNNTQGIMSTVASTPHHLSEKGKLQAVEAARWLSDKKIDLIITSPFVRTRETADIIAHELHFSEKNIISEPWIGELNAGVYNGTPFTDFVTHFPVERRFEDTPEKGENYADIKKRMGDFLYDCEKKYSGKHILIVTHDSPAFLLVCAARGLDRKESIALRGHMEHFMKNGQPLALDFTPLPHNAAYELDFHRPHIDTLELTLDGKRLVRVPEVFDCWFEAGSMPFAEAHYPFESGKNSDQRAANSEHREVFDPRSGFFKKSKGYPADFIAEGQDQTRGWFYVMLVLGVALFDKASFKNVVVNGIVLAEDGQKMSKSKNNYSDITVTINKYGADALRYYLLSSPLVRAQEFCFSEKGLDEVVKKHISRLNNVVAFYELYSGADAYTHTPHIQASATSPYVLDRWIIARLAALNTEVTQAMEAYELDKATRPFADFIDDMSTWYIRRSRDRFKNVSTDAEKTDRGHALSTTGFVLRETAKLLAPFMPFLAEDMYMRLRQNGHDAGVGEAAVHKEAKESVHFCQWPEMQIKKTDAELLSLMKEVRKIASLGLEARMQAKINVRQPLARLSVKMSATPLLSKLLQSSKESAAKNPALDFTSLILDEVNVKELVWNEGLMFDVELDTVVTPALKEEGSVRELIRSIQDIRKEQNLTISDLAMLEVATDAAGKAFIEKNKMAIVKATGLKDIVITIAVTTEPYQLTLKK